MVETPGDRLYRIRLACGDGTRRAEPLASFVRRVQHVTGEKYHATTVSMLERNQQGWRLSDVRAFAAVDPLKRGPTWLSALEESDPQPVTTAPRARGVDAQAELAARGGRRTKKRRTNG